MAKYPRNFYVACIAVVLAILAFPLAEYWIAKQPTYEEEVYVVKPEDFIGGKVGVWYKLTDGTSTATTAEVQDASDIKPGYLMVVLPDTSGSEDYMTCFEMYMYGAGIGIKFWAYDVVKAYVDAGREGAFNVRDILVDNHPTNYMVSVESIQVSDYESGYLNDTKPAVTRFSLDYKLICEKYSRDYDIGMRLNIENPETVKLRPNDVVLLRIELIKYRSVDINKYISQVEIALAAIYTVTVAVVSGTVKPERRGFGW